MSATKCKMCEETPCFKVLEENLGCCSLACLEEFGKQIMKKLKKEQPLLQCSQCSSFFDFEISADGKHCSTQCAYDSGTLLNHSLEHWIMLGHLPPLIPVSKKTSK